ncbi:MAG: T9SS type A sorting domain-containing protein [Paludibacter sp.]|nr:T9SS type A sorting domain-containing protein [Paludibacter sp.]
MIKADSDPITIYPNPATNSVSIKAQSGINGEITISDLSGKQVLSVKAQDTKIDISGLSKGVYLVRINNQMLKLIKE